MFEKFNKHVFHRTMQNIKGHVGNQWLPSYEKYSRAH